MKENEEYEGVFIEELIIYEYLADTDPENAEPIEEKELMKDVEDLKYTDAYDQYISVLVKLQKYDGFSRSLLTRRKQDLDRNIILSHHYNPLLNTRV